jgi:hypothetical protein
MTDTNGRFSLKVFPGLDWNPLSARRDDPSIVVYKPGYEPLGDMTVIRHGFKGSDSLVAALKAGTTIKLRTLETAKLSNTRYISLGEVLPGGDIPVGRIPGLVEAINRQRKRAGVEPYPKVKQKGIVQ